MSGRGNAPPRNRSTPDRNTARSRRSMHSHFSVTNTQFRENGIGNRIWENTVRKEPAARGASALSHRTFVQREGADGH